MKRCPTDANVQELLIADRSFYHIVSKASIFAFLANTPEVEKYLDYLCLASAVDQWQETLTSMNKIIFDSFCCLKQSVKLKLVQLLEFIIEKNPNNLDNIVTNYFREFNAGTYVLSLLPPFIIILRQFYWTRRRSYWIVGCLVRNGYTQKRMVSSIPVKWKLSSFLMPFFYTFTFSLWFAF